MCVVWVIWQNRSWLRISTNIKQVSENSMISFYILVLSNMSVHSSVLQVTSVAFSVLYVVWSNERGNFTPTADPHCDYCVAIIKVAKVDTGPDTRPDRYQLSYTRRLVTTYTLSLISKHWERKVNIFIMSLNQKKKWQSLINTSKFFDKGIKSYQTRDDLSLTLS